MPKRTSKKFAFKDERPPRKPQSPVARMVNVSDLRRELRFFLSQDTTKGYWEGLDIRVHCRTQYVFFSFQDLLYHLQAKFADKLSCKNWAYDEFGELRWKRFVKARFTKFDTLYAFTAPKKRVDRWFLQNINRLH